MTATAGGTDVIVPSGRVPLIALTEKLMVGSVNVRATAGAVVDAVLLRRANLGQRDVAVKIVAGLPRATVTGATVPS